MIRLVTAADFAAIAAIQNHWIRTTAIHFGYEEQAPHQLHDAWFASRDIHPWLVLADDEGAVIGFAKAGTWRARAAYRWITETGIYLAPDRCGRGLGQPLYRRLLDVLRAQGFHAAMAGIALPNAASVRLHERLGFTGVGTVPRAGRKFDRWHDVGFWHLPLQAADHTPTRLDTPDAAFVATAANT